MGDQWLNSVLCFPLGIYCYYKKTKIESKNTALYGFLLISLFLISFISRYAFGLVLDKTGGALLPIIELLFQIVSAVSLALYSIRIVSIVNVKNSIFQFIGTNSLCIYLYHLFFLSMFSFIENIWAYMITVFLSTIGLTMIYIFIDRSILLQKK